MVKEVLSSVPKVAFLYRIAVWHLKYLLGLRVSSVACGFYLTSKCNLRCKFCNIWRINPSFQVSVDEAQRLIRQLGDLGIIYFSFSGGEALLVPYVFDLLRYAKKRGILYTHIVSNGFLLDEERAKEMTKAQVSEVSFSLDGPEKYHDRVRGVEGAFQKVLTAVDYMKTYAPHTKVVLNSILSPLYPEYALQAMETARELGVKIKFQPINDHPDFKSTNPAEKWDRSLEPEQKKKLLQVIKILQLSPSVVNSRPFLENYKAFLFSPDNLIFFNDACIFGYHHLEFFNDCLYPCLEGMEWKNGFDIHKESLKNILASSAYKQKLSRLKQCTECRKAYYVCYYEPRLNFPVWNFLSARFRQNFNHDEPR